MSARGTPLPGFQRDPLFWLAIVGGAVVATGIGRWLPSGDGLSGDRIAWVIVVTVLVYPVLEELAFRGGLQRWLLSYPRGRVSWLGISVANVVTTAAFSALHLLHHPPMWAALVAVPSLVFGFFRDRHDAVLPAIILHALYNLFYLLAVEA